MKADHARLHEALAALAPPKRFELLLLMLAGAERSVSQLAAAVKLSQSCTTRHLQALERAGLVKGVRDGKRVVFRPLPSDAPAASVLASLPGGVDAAGGSRAAGARPSRASSVGNTRPASRVRTPPSAAGAGRSGPAREPASSRAAGVPGWSAAVGPLPVTAPSEPMLPADHAPAQPASESGNNSRPESSAVSPRPRARQDLEDFLL